MVKISEEQVIEQCRRDFYSFFLAFGKEYHGEKFVTGHWNREYCEALQYEGLYSALRGEMPIMTLEAPVQHGKHLKYNEKIKTANRGWVRHIDLVPFKDYVFGDDGKPHLVIGNSGGYLWPHKKIYFKNGYDPISCSPEHLWKVGYDRRTSGVKKNGKLVRGTRKTYKDFRICETRDIFNQRNVEGRNSPCIQGNPALCMPSVYLPCDPYILGLWLGNGTQKGGNIEICWDDADDLSLKTGFGIKKNDGKNSGVMVLPSGYIPSECRIEKHIPDIFMNAGTEQRWELFRGLMDTDGYVDPRGRCEFSQSVDQHGRLLEDFYELARSLGLKPTRIKEEVSSYKKGGVKVITGTHQRYCFSVPRGTKVFNSTRKQERLDKKATGDRADMNRFYIEKIEDEGMVYGNCIQVEGGMYLAGRDMIPTHNSHALVLFACWTLGNWQKYRRRINYYTASKDTAKDFAQNMSAITSSKTFVKCFGGVKHPSAAEYYLGDARLSMRLAGGGNIGYSSNMTLIDDPYASYLEALSPTLREKKWQSCLGNLLSRRQSVSLTVVMHSRWFSDDMIGRIKDKSARGEYKGNKMIHHCWPALNDKGEALFPEFRSAEFLEAQRSAMNELLFMANYMQKPIDLEKSNINVQKFKRFKPEEAHDNPDMSYITVDSAFSTRDKSDQSVMMWHTVQGGVHQVRDAQAGRWDFETLRSKVKNFALETGCDTIWIENKASGQSLLQVLQSEIERGLFQGNVLPLYPTAKKDLVTGDEQTADKFTRWLEVSPALDHGCIYIPEEADWLDEFLKQCMAFDGKGGYHDDFIDAFIYGIKLSINELDFTRDKNYVPDAPVEIEEPDWDEDFSFGTISRGINDGGISI